MRTPKLFSFRTYTSFGWPLHFTLTHQPAFKYLHEDGVTYTHRAFYLTIGRRTFLLETHWPVRNDRCNGVPQ